MLGRRRRRRTNIKTTSGLWLVYTGCGPTSKQHWVNGSCLLGASQHQNNIGSMSRVCYAPTQLRTHNELGYFPGVIYPSWKISDERGESVFIISFCIHKLLSNAISNLFPENHTLLAGVRSFWILKDQIKSKRCVVIALPIIVEIVGKLNTLF